MFRTIPVYTLYSLFFIFSDKFEIVTKCGISNSITGQKRFGLYLDRFHISRILWGYTIFTNSLYTIFAGNVKKPSHVRSQIELRHPSTSVYETIFFLHYYVCGCGCEFVKASISKCGLVSCNYVLYTIVWLWNLLVRS